MENRFENDSNVKWKVISHEIYFGSHIDFVGSDRVDSLDWESDSFLNWGKMWKGYNGICSKRSRCGQPITAPNCSNINNIDLICNSFYIASSPSFLHSFIHSLETQEIQNSGYDDDDDYDDYDDDDDDHHHHHFHHHHHNHHVQMRLYCFRSCPLAAWGETSLL